MSRGRGEDGPGGVGREGDQRKLPLIYRFSLSEKYGEVLLPIVRWSPCMRFLPPNDEVVLYETVFQDDFLNRKRISESLSKALERIEDPLVVAFNGPWGTGKSHFLKRWVGAHTKQNQGTALTLYFDAFAHDYLSDPLIALVGAISTRLPNKEKSKLDKIKAAASKLIKPSARVGLSMVTFGATEALGDLGDAAALAIQNESNIALEKFWEKEEGRQAAMEEFRFAIDALTTLDGGKTSRPFIIVVDELDRCRPDYSLEILEIIKHFFNVPKVHFVLGVNLVALENSVRARYGHEIDSTKYLQKFLSFTISLPDHAGDRERTPNVLKYVEKLAEEMGTPQRLAEEIKVQIDFLLMNNHISMRDIAKIMSTASLIHEDGKLEGLFPGYRSVIIALLISQIVNPRIFNMLLSSNISEKELSTYLGATEQTVNEKLADGSYNPDCNRRLIFHYHMWMWICLNGKLKLNEKTPAVSRWFSDYDDLSNPKRLPREIFEKYLSIFHVT